MLRQLCFLIAALCAAAVLVPFTGCGTTRSTDTTRTATEQLLISDAIDRAVGSMNFRTLTGQTVFLDDTKLTDTVDKNYYISTLRQQLLANGCDLRDKRDDADFIVEARAGAIGTDRNDLLFGIPSMNVPQIPLVQPVPAAIPEIPIAKRKDQRGIAKIAVFAYHRATGTPVWQSGIVCQESSSNDVWIFGAGPFQHGTIYDNTEFAGQTIKNDPKGGLPTAQRATAVAISKESLFTPPQQFPKSLPSQGVVVASHQEPVTPATKPGATTPATPPPVASVVTPQSASPAATAAALIPGSTSATGKEAAPITPLATAPVASSVPATKPVSPPPPAAFANVGDSTPLPQPRFNSPQ
jgi:hypothetical protein